MHTVRSKPSRRADKRYIQIRARGEQHQPITGEAMRLERRKPSRAKRPARLESRDESLRPVLDACAPIAGHHGADSARFQEPPVAAAERIGEHRRREAPQTRQPRRMVLEVTGKEWQQRIVVSERAVEVEQRHRARSG